jgi:hypothetical protein
MIQLSEHCIAFLETLNYIENSIDRCSSGLFESCLCGAGRGAVRKDGGAGNGARDATVRA